MRESQLRQQMSLKRWINLHKKKYLWLLLHADRCVFCVIHFHTCTSIYLRTKMCTQLGVGAGEWERKWRFNQKQLRVASDGIIFMHHCLHHLHPMDIRQHQSLPPTRHRHSRNALDFHSIYFPTLSRCPLAAIACASF